MNITQLTPDPVENSAFWVKIAAHTRSGGKSSIFGENAKSCIKYIVSVQERR